LAVLSDCGELPDDLPEEAFEEAFKMFDTNGDGTISKDEMKVFVKQVCGLA